MIDILELSEHDRENIKSPKFKEAGRVHDWRNYVHEEIKKRWSRLSMESRIVCYYTADSAASREEWD